MQSADYNKLPLELRQKIYDIFNREIASERNPHFQTGMTYILNLLFGFQNYSVEPSTEKIKTFIVDGYVTGVNQEGNIHFIPETDDNDTAIMKNNIIKELYNLKEPAKCRVQIIIEK